MIFSQEIKVDLIKNYISLEIENNKVDFFLSSNLNDFIILDKETQKNYNLSKKVSFKVGNIDFKDVTIKNGEKNIIGFGLLKDFIITVDYKNSSLIINSPDVHDGLDFTEKNGFINCKASLLNFNYSGDFLIDTNEFYSFINNNFFKDIKSDKKIFPKIDDYFPNVYYYEDIDLDIGGKFYNYTFMFNEGQNSLGLDYFRNSTISINFKEKKIKIVNNNEVTEWLFELLSKNNLSELTNFLENNKQVKDYHFFKSLYYKRLGRDDIAKTILFEKLQNSTDEKLLKLLFSLIKEFPNKSDFIKLQSLFEKNPELKKVTNDEKILQFSDYDKIGEIYGNNGVVKYRLWKNKIFPFITINKIKTGSILFDTGWPSFTITSSMAKKLKVKTIVKDAVEVTSSFRNGEAVFWDYGIVDEITLGGIKLKNVVCTITKKPIFPGIDGVIGGKIINQFNCIIDRENEVVCFQKRKYDNLDFTKSNMSLINDKPYIKINFEKNQNDYFIHFDTGNDTTFGSNLILIESVENINKLKCKRLFSYDVLGFDSYDVFEKKESILIENEIFIKNDFFYRVQNAFYYQDIIKNYGNIGFDIFDKHNLYINYDKMILTPKKIKKSL
ncbi:MAG TPA: retropepsin-like aspartic protease [Spirochaetota bacterium]|nr:retropepsin-like aspartic protease [Spirochaetota bacterium]